MSRNYSHTYFYTYSLAPQYHVLTRLTQTTATHTCTSQYTSVQSQYQLGGQVHTYTYTYTYTHTHTHTHIPTYPHIHIHIDIHIYTYTYMYIHCTHTHTHTYTYTYTQLYMYLLHSDIPKAGVAASGHGRVAHDVEEGGALSRA